MDVSQANENELQKAIDDITSGATASQPGASSDVASELEAKIQGQMGTPPAPEVPADGAMPEGVAPGVVPEGAVPEMAMPEMPTSSVEAMNPSVSEDAPAEEATPAIVGSAGVPVVDSAPEAQEVPVTVSAPEAPAPEVPVATPEVSGDLGAVKQAMLRDLYPLMDKVNLAPEQKYDVYKEMIESTGDKDMIPAAYEAVKGITDDAAKAEALLYLVDKAE